MSVLLRAGNSYTNAETLTNGDGTFEFARSDPRSFAYFAAEAVEIKSIERPGYLWASQPQIETRNGTTTIANLTLKKRGAVFAGRVIGEDGRGAAGAWVAVLEARNYPLVQAKSDGSFEMPDLPLEKFTLIGASDTGFGRSQTEPNAANFALTLAPNAEFDREKLAARALQGKVELGDAQNYGPYLDAARRLDLIERIQKDQRSYNAADFARQLERRDPQEFLKRAPALIELVGKDGQQALALEAKVYALRAVSGEADDRIAANAWLDEQKAVKREINATSVTQLLQMAVVADRLKREDAAGWLDYAAAIAAQLKGNVLLGGWGEPLARLGWGAMTPFVDEMTPPVRVQLLEDGERWTGA